MPSMPRRMSIYLNKPALLTGGEIDLRYVTSDHHLGIETHAGENHFHLLRRSVLRFIDNDKAVVECTASHEGDRGDLNRPSFQKLFTRSMSIMSCSASYRGRRYGSTFSWSVPEESQFLACFYGGTGQQNPADTFIQQGRNRHGYSEVRLAGAGRPNAEREIVAVDRVDITTLVHRLRRKRFLAEGALPATIGQATKRHVGIREHHPKIAVQVTVLEDKTFPQQA